MNRGRRFRARGKRPATAILPYRCDECDGIHVVKVLREGPETRLMECPKAKIKTTMHRIHVNPKNLFRGT